VALAAAVPSPHGRDPVGDGERMVVSLNANQDW